MLNTNNITNDIVTSFLGLFGWLPKYGQPYCNMDVRNNTTRPSYNFSEV